MYEKFTAKQAMSLYSESAEKYKLTDEQIQSLIEEIKVAAITQHCHIYVPYERISPVYRLHLDAVFTRLGYEVSTSVNKNAFIIEWSE